jgi:hypothetical protein
MRIYPSLGAATVVIGKATNFDIDAVARLPRVLAVRSTLASDICCRYRADSRLPKRRRPWDSRSIGSERALTAQSRKRNLRGPQRRLVRSQIQVNFDRFSWQYLALACVPRWPAVLASSTLRL